MSFDRFQVPLRMLLLLASASTALTGVWLIYTTLVILPAHDPAHIPMWRSIAIAFFAYSALSCVYAVTGSRAVWLRILVLVVSVAAIVLGIHSVFSMIQDQREGGHVEGYIFLMALLLGGHGLIAILYTLSYRIGRGVRAVG
jgi:hypothetical protein